MIYVLTSAGDSWQDLSLVFCNPSGGFRNRSDARASFAALLKRIGLPRLSKIGCSAPAQEASLDGQN